MKKPIHVLSRLASFFPLLTRSNDAKRHTHSLFLFPYLSKMVPKTKRSGGPGIPIFQDTEQKKREIFLNKTKTEPTYPVDHSPRCHQRRRKEARMRTKQANCNGSTQPMDFQKTPKKIKTPSDFRLSHQKTRPKKDANAD